MTNINIQNIEFILKSYYGATKVFVDNDEVSVYGSDIDSVYVALSVEYGSEYDIFYQRRNDILKEVVLKLVKKDSESC